MNKQYTFKLSNHNVETIMYLFYKIPKIRLNS